MFRNSALSLAERMHAQTAHPCTPRTICVCCRACTAPPNTRTRALIDEAERPALALGIGFQITNILRDVGEDAVRGRIYLPLEARSATSLARSSFFGRRGRRFCTMTRRARVARAREEGRARD